MLKVVHGDVRGSGDGSCNLVEGKRGAGGCYVRGSVGEKKGGEERVVMCVGQWGGERREVKFYSG